jgi:5-oxoprolinase (ATP-hydrolysing)
MTPDAGLRGWHFAIDRGGTFTDVVGVSPTGELHTLKVLSRDPLHAGDPAVRGIESMLGTHDATGRLPVQEVRLGTTVATNALLERKGEPTLIVTTRGLRDAFRIGYQNRPDIFARAIRLAPPLYAEVIEADERIAADGDVLSTLDEAALRRELALARGRGLTSVAIVFMHGYRYPHHERRAAGIAREVGFAEISVSHEIAAIQGLVARGDTTIADAYLSPVLLRYVSGFGDELTARFPGAHVEFMQSNGGLTDAAGFRGVDALLSGPAGGVVGMIEIGADQGRDRIIGLDMGGTSTDLALYAGELPRRYLSEIDGVRVQAPMMDIHTIAAGGGSIVRYADGRLQVGPDSAGADPGPACYRRSGPATITDCNLVLGRIQADWFPKVFGPHGDAPLDPQASRQRLGAIADALAADGSHGRSIEALASGFIDVAVARMSYAVRELALRQGHDPSQFALLCFGGAAGQHACAIAEALGCREIVLPALAGVLSAWGIGRARKRCVRRRTVEVELASWPTAEAEAQLGALADRTRQALLRQGVRSEAIELKHTAQLRLAGSDSALEVRWARADAMRAEFAAAYRRTYGFLEESQPLIVTALVVEAVASVDAGHGPPRRAHPDGAAAPSSTVDLWLDARWQRVPLHPRAALRRATVLEGPVLIAEDGATSFVARGWSGSLTDDGNLVLRSGASSSPVRSRPGGPDPTRLEVMNGLFMHVAEQMGVVLQQTASSVNIKERLDFSCALFDAEAQLVANAPHMPVHLGSMGASVAAVTNAHAADLRPGDAYLVNSPYDGGTHLPDLTVVTPVFDTGQELRFYTASRAHHADIGGLTPGSMPPGSRRIEEEGVLVPATRIVRDGRLDEALLRQLLGAGSYPARNPEQNLADLRAQLAANARGIRELERAARASGYDGLAEDMRAVQDNAEACARRAIRRLAGGEFRYELDNGQAIQVRIDVDHERGAAVVDFSGTSAQQDNNFNAPRAVTVAAVLYVFRTLIEEAIPLNAGCLRPLSIIVPQGSMLDPRWPSAVVAGNVETSQCIVDALYGALGLQAASQGTMNNFTFGNERYQYYETIAGGAGAGPDYDGASGVQTHMTNSRLTDPEVLESRFPVLLRRFALRAESGGCGRQRGGDGLIRSVEFLEPMTAAILSNHRRVAPFGLAGGGAGATGINRLLRRDGSSVLLASTAEVGVEPGDVVTIETPGGGAFGQRKNERR